MNPVKKIFNNPKWLAVFVGTVIFLAALGYSTVEDKSMFSGLWWVIVTFCTVGYGDMYPNLIVGKLLAMALMVLAVFVLAPTITAHMSARLIVDSNAFTHEEQELIKQNSADARNLLGQIQEAQAHLDADLDALRATQAQIQVTLAQMAEFQSAHGFTDDEQHQVLALLNNIHAHTNDEKGKTA